MRVAVTGIGMITALGAGAEANWAAMRQGRSGVRRIARFDTEGLRTRIAASVDFPEDAPGGRYLSVPARCERMAALAIAEALAQSGRADGGGMPLVLGQPPVEVEWPARARLAAGGYAAALAEGRADRAAFEEFAMAGVSHRLAQRFRTRGAPQAVTTACASGASAIQLALEALRRGECDAALAAGTEASLQPETLIRFSLLQALSTRNDEPERASRPFTLSRDGFVMGDGAAALVLEREEAARARGAAILGYVLGCGERADTFHRTRSAPDGAAITGAMRRALADAALAPEDVDYVNAHGTSTPENDKMEALAVREVFGERRPPVSSTKSMIGHTLSAAGAIEAAVTLLALRDQALPPTINQDDPDAELGLDTVPESRPHAFRAAMSNSFGFGGQNVCVVLGAAE